MVKNEIDDFLEALGGLISSIKHLPPGEIANLDPLSKEHLAELLDVLIHQMTMIFSQLKDVEFRCPYCRKISNQYLGFCVQCKQAACDLCGISVEGYILHRGACSAFYHNEKEEDI